MICKTVSGGKVQLGRIEQCLGRDTSHIQAGATQHRVTFDDGRLHSQLSTANGSYIAPGAAANYSHIKLLHSFGFQEGAKVGIMNEAKVEIYAERN